MHRNTSNNGALKRNATALVMVDSAIKPAPTRIATFIHSMVIQAGFETAFGQLVETIQRKAALRIR
ncbi:hypothetical protein [Hydrogenophaga sp.]|uniref:hypothetical protein n=1 Tax=Hydrogenophaga sp. TaxID=1904254 RepID=UPI0027369B4E|nr:hypothetical protein [Hydrogenophaga sp.]MDP3474576.1 hypothetical protein [Hydrogenophaga sp.]